MWATDNPIKAMGPTNAVTDPVKIQVAEIINRRVVLKFTPKLCA